MSSVSSAALPVTGAGIVIAGTAIGVEWVAAAGAACVIAGFVVIRYASRIRAHRAR